MAEQISKQEAVRRALKAMGRDATPTQMQPYIKEHFGIEMSTNHISSSKGMILHKKKTGKGKGGEKPAAPEAVATEGEAMKGAGRKALVRQKPAPAGEKEAGISLD